MAAVVAPFMVPLTSASDPQGHKLCPIGSPLSCHLESGGEVDRCCVNTPGGILLLAQFWDYDPAIGPDDSWTIHGLWPDNCDGSYEQSCDAHRNYNNITQILESFEGTELLTYMEQYWKDMKGNGEALWEHEWNKHGTCVSTLEPQCFNGYTPQQEAWTATRQVDPAQWIEEGHSADRVNQCRQALHKAGIVPSHTATYHFDDVVNALSEMSGAEPAVRCHGGKLNEIWYFFNVRGSASSGQYVPTKPDGSKSNCPKDGIEYPPKKSPHSKPVNPGIPGPNTPFSGKGYLHVFKNGRQEGCLITGGNWYVSGSCATYTAMANENGFTLKTRKGPCGVLKGAFACGGGAQEKTFKDDNGTLTFYANSIPSGTTKVPVYFEQGDAAHTLQVSWQSK
ncbi:ribonuclease T2-like [Ascosphaera aggregata]|nr:ribonuclease T2-like [Ascosphaera aggregata]